ncbi:MAG: TIGR03618 family F420-dependent PPOX class oxidoreductase [Candidatus Binatus sp.]|uniref:pyridoxamine 5'-phosphate oxidase family protein n=1 Tax=Candidatus Binatus sp. TaxID=2811406 RepID=UPI002727B630|nr:TIGR03618 family F420-dependent PPOX class oxidoreductase [Candidatus Binatus sp.]MDO8431397.1 TIGR03618 family F420-dependent PPOX class oxidoreductase [Candidatus Binatus sp.]
MKRRDQIKLTPAEQEEFLSKAPKAALATIDKDGYPHVVAMNYLWRDGAILMTSYGKAQKVVNIRRNPRVGVMVETGRAYSDLRGVLIRGECEIIEDVATVNATMNAIRNRYSGGGQAENTALTTAPKRVVLKVIPQKIASWDHRKLGGRY